MRKTAFVFVFSVVARLMSAQNPVSYCVENEITHDFLNDFSYDSLDLTVSYVMKYFNKPHDYRLDAPVPVRLSWNHEAGADAQRVEVSESSVYTDSIVFTINKDTAQYDLYNMIPGKKYYYRIVSVKGGDETVVKKDSLEPTGMLRWLYVEGTWNVRDMGGWPGLGGHPIKYGQLFRGAQLTNPKDPYNVILTSAGKEAMRNAGIHAELDLRSSSQAHYSTASFATNSYAADFTNIATTSARMWQYDKDDSNIRAIQWVINELKAGKPVFYHCQNGADRTGTIGLLIGALLGMSESDLAKDYELTTFCQKAAVAFDPTEVGFARLRNYEGKKGSKDSSSDPKDYMFAPVIDKLNTISGGSTQRKIYDFFRKGVGNTKISESDLDWFIKEMVDYVLVKDSKFTIGCSTSYDANLGDVIEINAKVSQPDATNPTIKYSTTDSTVAAVSDAGVITIKGRGTATVSVEVDGLVKEITVNVPTIESYKPSTVLYNGLNCPLKNNVYLDVKNGSFDNGNNFVGWLKIDEKTPFTGSLFNVRFYENSDSCYIESTIDGDESSEGSLCSQWTIQKNKVYVFGYKVKNSTDLKSENNANLRTVLTTKSAKDESAAQVLQAPTYDGNWTDVQYVFSSGNYNRIRISFTHLSKDGNNTCFDNFYLAEVDVAAGVKKIIYEIEGDRYDLNGRKVENEAGGIIIKEGKKYLNK